MRKRSKFPFPTLGQFLMAPRMMRRLSIWMLDNDLTFEEARHWEMARRMLHVHLEKTYEPKWRRTAPAELRVVAGLPVDFDPELLPYGVPGLYHPETFAAVRKHHPRP